MKNQPFLSISLNYLDLGWSLIPIIPESKKPAFKWKKYQYEKASKEDVERWIEKGYHLAVVTGQVSNIVVVDDDRIKNNLPEYGLSSNIISTSKSGGKHYYFRYDREITQSINHELHVDIKARGGYVLLPPFNGRQWVIEPTTERLAKLPTLLPALETALRPTPKQTSPSNFNLSDYIGIPDGQGRKDHLHSLACRLFYKHTKNDAITLLQAVNSTYSPPITEEEFKHNVETAYQFFLDNPVGVSVPVDLSNLKKKLPEALPAPELDIIPLSDYMNLEFPKAQWLIKNLIRSDGLNFVIGQSGVGKSLLCLSIIKAIAAGEPWLTPEFSTKPMKVLIVDKENSDIDLQNNLRDMNVQGDVSIFKSAALFDFVDHKQVLTPAATKLQTYVQENNVDVILLDSMIDFYVGSEDSSTDFNFNHQTWKQVFGNRCVLTIHHENKQPVKGKRSAKDRARGSSNIVAQANSIISISSDEARPELITIEHTKVRGAKKHDTFQVVMETETEYISGRSKVTGFSWKGVIDIKHLAEDRASDAVLQFLAKSPDRFIPGTEIIAAICSEELGDAAIGSRAAGTAIAKMRGLKQVDFQGNGTKNNPYVYRYPVALIDKMLADLTYSV